MTAPSIPAPDPGDQRRLFTAAVTLLVTLVTLAALMVAGSCNDPNTVMNDPNDPMGKVLRDWRDDVQRGDDR